VEHFFELKPTSGILFRAERASHEWLQQQQEKQMMFMGGGGGGQ
jgi:hypothetical protein